MMEKRNARPGPYELQDPLWVKMSAITGGITKKRKKSDAKPQSQSQHNKCLNEKRRRTQENTFIDELAELISATEMSSGKTDKCQILQRTVDQIRHFRQQEGSNSHAVQQGEVSSSNPNILSNDQVGPILLEALDGFLFVVNTEGRVEYVTENITQYINYTKDDVLGKDIYNIIHHGDHNTFMPSLLPMSSLGWTSEPQPQTRNRTFNCRFLVKPPDDKDETMEEKQQRVSKYESMQICSALLPSNADRLESGDVSSESSDIGPCVMCVARRIPPIEKPIGPPPVEQFTVKLDTTGKIIAVDVSWLSPVYSKYLSKDLIGTTIKDLCHPHDLSTLTKHLSDTLQLGENTSDVYRLRVSPDKFLKIQTKSKFFKASVMNVLENDFMMATSSILGDNDLMSIESGQLSNNKMCSGHPSNRCANSNNNNGNNNNNVGGPLMPVAHLSNGQVSGISARGMAVSHAATSSNSIAFNTGSTGGGGSGSGSDSCNPLTSLSTSSANPFNHFSGNMDLEFELFPSSTPWDLDSSAGWVDRPESRTSGPPNSRPSSQPAPTSPSSQGTFSNSAAVASHCSPLRSFSPTVSATHTFSNSFPFSPLQETTQTSTLSSNVASSINTNGGNVSGIGSNTATTTIKRTEESSKSGCPTSNSGGGTMDNATARTSSAVETQNTISTESGRLRNLLTKGPSASEDSQDNTNNDSDNQNKHRILKILLNQQDEDDYHSEHKVRTSPSNMSKSSMEHSKSSLGNNMLLQLLNEKNDDEDDETRPGVKKRNELLQQLMKDPDEERKLQEQQNREDDSLLRSLGFRNTTPSPSQSSDHVALGSSTQVGQKRPGEDGDLNVAVKRPVDGSHQVSSSGTGSSSNATSKLWEKNKMLASLLAKQPPQTTNVPTKLPASIISATPQDKLPRLTAKQQQQQQQQQHQQQQQQQQQPQQQQPWTGGSMQVGGNNTITTTATSARSLQSQSRQLPRQSANTYLSHISQQQRPQMGTTESEFAGSGEYHQTNTDPTTWDNPASDPDLSEILDQVIDFVPDQSSADTSPIANLLSPLIEAPQNVLNEKMAINAIQKSLMLCETAVNPTSSTITIPGTPPAYSTALGTTPVTTSHSYQPPPMYQQPRIRFTQPGVRQTSQFTQQQLQLHQQRSKLNVLHQQQQHQQEQMKQRLLQQQKQQQMVIPSNATATDQINSSIHNIDNLLNNTVAPPNVSLQRSSVPDSQISPGYGGSVQMPSGHRLAHSYSHPSTISQHPIVNNNFNSGQQVSAPARLSPHSPAGILPFSHPQPLSPRVTQGNYGNTPRLFNVNQVRPQQQQQLQQQQRSMPSPGTPASARQSPFPTETFPPPTSPTASQFTPGPTTGAPNPSAQYRLQRATSTPSATTQLPGGIGSPRHYGGISKEPLLSPSHSHSACPATPTHSQHSNTQHFSSQQHNQLLYQQHNANTLNTADMQNSQFCYDRSSVPLYPSGGEAQDARSLPPGNPVNHQMGGNVTSEFVRQEIRARIVGSRTQQQQQQQQQRVPNNLQPSGQVSQDDFDALGLTFEMSSAGEAVVSDGPAKSWAIGSAGSAPSSSRTTMEEVARGDPKSSLLQKLLSE
ncbi:nuclear receptor coactivator 2-like isoform X3 [Cataglyphis hispanica]|uniref:nuclear receptor coactivator 2-like isoform X3 n=1 Tax=Cataglyphis hispanica TaxID=1086592 RepID=UPI0021802E89|nr:nuclear receptor coactivator 2-like isoform X3 [Cataglyphis hispanica]